MAAGMCRAVHLSWSALSFLTLILAAQVVSSQAGLPTEFSASSRRLLAEGEPFAEDGVTTAYIDLL